ncbi:MAG: hypothetical protein KME64_23200 [Scytonematopsis contorta HA4267-MV1]|nr:hypothetical protein [Scytonematopsis contorta HA4267-MV1]
MHLKEFFPVIGKIFIEGSGEWGIGSGEWGIVNRQQSKVNRQQSTVNRQLAIS